MTWEMEDYRKYENELIHNRLTWLGVFEGLLFVAYDKGQHPILLPLIGLAIAVSIGVGISASNRELTKHGGQAYPPRSVGYYLMPGTAIPVIIGIAWLVLLVRPIKTLLCR